MLVSFIAWTIDADGVLIQTDPEGGDEFVKVTRVGGSTRAISANVVNFGETESIPVALLIPQPVTEATLGGVGNSTDNITSKIYEMTLPDGAPIKVTFKSNGEVTTNEDDVVSEFEVGGHGENIITTGEIGSQERTLIILLGGDLSVAAESVNILFVDVTSRNQASDLEYNEMGVGTITLQ